MKVGDYEVSWWRLGWYRFQTALLKGLWLTGAFDFGEGETFPQCWRRIWLQVTGRK